MRKKTICVVIIAATLGTVAVLYRTFQPNTYRVEDILAVYQENADYGDITIEYPHNETLFPPEMILPLFRWKDCVPVSRAWLSGIEFTDGKPHMYFLAHKSGDTLPISSSHWRELKVYACPIGGTFFDELCLIMIGFDSGQRLELSMLAPELPDPYLLSLFFSISENVPNKIPRKTWDRSTASGFWVRDLKKGLELVAIRSRFWYRCGIEKSGCVDQLSDIRNLSSRFTPALTLAAA